MITLSHISKAFAAQTVVDDVSFTIEKGEFFALLGPSGCGKTTLMRMIAGLETPSKGAITLDGLDITHTPPHLRPVNLMFQNYALFPHLSVYDNIAFGLRYDKTPLSRVDEMLALLKLESFAKRMPDQLSGGQKQRVALARALAKRPALLLLDEPLGALDTNLREEMQAELKRLQRETGITFMAVTHDREEAMVLADRIAIMQTGKILQIASPKEIYETPVNAFVAGFMGHVNPYNGGFFRPEQAVFDDDGIPVTIQNIAYKGAYADVSVTSQYGIWRIHAPSNFTGGTHLKVLK
jgi:putrescine transport system ATP-binding protein